MRYNTFSVVSQGIDLKRIEVEVDGVTWGGWGSCTKLSDGSTAQIRFLAATRYGLDEGTIYYPSIEVYRKRKNSNLYSGQITGKVGLEAAGFFLQTLTLFEANVPRGGDSIVAQGYDGRRFRAYHKVLAKRGYHATVDEGIPSIVKKF